MPLVGTVMTHRDLLRWYLNHDLSVRRRTDVLWFTAVQAARTAKKENRQAEIDLIHERFVVEVGQLIMPTLSLAIPAEKSDSPFDRVRRSTCRQVIITRFSRELLHSEVNQEAKLQNAA